MSNNMLARMRSLNSSIPFPERVMWQREAGVPAPQTPGGAGGGEGAALLVKDVVGILVLLIGLAFVREGVLWLLSNKALILEVLRIGAGVLLGGWVLSVIALGLWHRSAVAGLWILGLPVLRLVGNAVFVIVFIIAMSIALIFYGIGVATVFLVFGVSLGLPFAINVDEVIAAHLPGWTLLLIVPGWVFASYGIACVAGEGRGERYEHVL